jgi:hypothetical protein
VFDPLDPLDIDMIDVFFFMYIRRKRGEGFAQCRGECPVSYGEICIPDNQRGTCREQKPWSCSHCPPGWSP